MVEENNSCQEDDHFKGLQVRQRKQDTPEKLCLKPYTHADEKVRHASVNSDAQISWYST